MARPLCVCYEDAKMGTYSLSEWVGDLFSIRYRNNRNTVQVDSPHPTSDSAEH